MRDGSPSRGESGEAAGSRRRTFLKAAAGAGALSAGGLAGGLVGSSAAAGIPTPWLHREGNEIVDPTGESVILRGVNIVDPSRADENPPWRGKTATQMVDLATNEDEGWHSRIVRIPCQPGDIESPDGQSSGEPEPGAFSRSDLEYYLENYLRPVVDKCAAEGAYAIVDYHRHRTEDFTTQALHDEVTMFWETVAPVFAEDSHVLFEVYNEPIGPWVGRNDRDVNVGILDDRGVETWTTWREHAQPWVDTIREHAPRNLILIGSPRWTQWTYWAAEEEFAGDDLAYTAHVYTHEGLRPLDDYFGAPAEEVPVFLSEFGWDPEANQSNSPFLYGTTEEYGPEFEQFLESYPIHWQVWCFDFNWTPAMFEKNFVDSEYKHCENPPCNWDLLGGEHQGVFFKEYLQEKKDADVPTAESGTPSPDPSTPTPPGTNESGTAGDLDDDGLYEDVNGNGESDFGDVTSLFDRMDAVEDGSRFDFNGNGELDFGDVVALFGRQ